MTNKVSVSVIIPAYNAAATIAATLRSARAQTHTALEIIVVNDGSSDGTAAVVEDHAAADPRVLAIHQENRGLAEARNAGIAVASGRYVAPLDADDLWAPDKLARQVAALEAAGAEAALAYNWFRQIDTADRILPPSPYPQVAGRVFHRHLDWNFISNGSTPLIRTAVARAIPYDPTLRGCEDYYFQLEVARRHGIVCVPAFLTGYRRYPGSMSSKRGWMIRAHLEMFARLEHDVGPAARGIIQARMAQLRRDRLRHHALAPLRTAFGQRAGPAPAAGEPFGAIDVEQRDGAWATRRSAAHLAELARLDAEFPHG